MTFYSRYPRPDPDGVEAEAAKHHLMAVLLAAVKALESANAALQVELNGWDDYRSCGCWMLPEEAGEMNYTVIFRLLDSWRDELERNYQAVAETKPTKPTRPPAT